MFLDIVYAILALLTGIGIFLAGINMLSSSLKRNSTQKMHAMFKKIGNNRFSGMGLGAGATAITQSSTAVTVMTVGLVNIGVLSLFQATAIIMGANIGTTLTSLLMWLSFLEIKYFFMVLVFVGIVMKMVCKKDRSKLIANVLISIGILFVGLNLMSAAFKGESGKPLSDFFANLFKNVEFPLLLIILGGLFTLVIQSSTASMAIYITMVGAGILSVDSALYLVLGSEIGTCATALLASLGGNRHAKQAAMIHLLYNVFSTVLFASIIWPFHSVLIPMYAKLIPDQVLQISLFPMIVNVVTTVVLIWFITPFNRFVCWMIKDKPNPEESIVAAFTDPRLLETPTFAISQTIKGLNYLGTKAKNNVEAAFKAVITDDLSQKEKIEKEEASINAITQSLSDYLVKISSTYISATYHKLTAGLHHVLSDLERIGDQAIIILHSAAKKRDSAMKFSDPANEELDKMFGKVIALYNVGLESDFLNNYSIAKQKNVTLKHEVDIVKEEIAETHIKRLQAGICSSGAAEYYYAVITSLKSVADHLINIDKILARLDKQKIKTQKIQSGNKSTAKQLSFSDV